MKYTKSKIKKYGWSNGIYYCLLPAIIKNLPKVYKNKILLDVGCGKLKYYNYFKDAGFNYEGLENSNLMIKEAKALYPNAKVIKGNALVKASYKKGHYNVVTNIMMALELNSLSKIKTLFKNINYTLKPKGVFILAIPNPYYSKYMQELVLNLGEAKIDGKSYYKSPSKIIYTPKSLKIQFVDYHYSLQDYFTTLTKCGFKVIKIDDCKVSPKAKKEVGVNYYQSKLKYPEYMVIKCVKNIS